MRVCTTAWANTCSMLCSTSPILCLPAKMSGVGAPGGHHPHLDLLNILGAGSEASEGSDLPELVKVVSKGEVGQLENCLLQSQLRHQPQVAVFPQVCLDLFNTMSSQGQDGLHEDTLANTKLNDLPGAGKFAEGHPAARQEILGGRLDND